jgi:hypothetical protein
MKKCAGLAQIPLMIALMLMAVALPVVSRLVKNNQETRNRAAETLNMPVTFWRLIGSECVVAGTFFTVDECQTVTGSVCFEDNTCGVGEEPSPEPTAGPGTFYYICETQPKTERLCTRSFPSEVECKNAIQNSSTQFCVNDCNTECLNVYSVCIDPKIIEKCGVTGFNPRDPECVSLLHDKGMPLADSFRSEINYFYADESNVFLARCFNFEYSMELVNPENPPMGEKECANRFGEQNCFPKVDDCRGVCPPREADNTVTPAPLITAYRCAEGRCQRQDYLSAEECFKENGFAGCLIGCSDEFCNRNENEEKYQKLYYYCDYSNAIEGSSFMTGVGASGIYRNIFECYSQHEKCTLLKSRGGEMGGCTKNLEEEDKKLKLYFCGASGCRWEIFKNWMECGAKHGVCYDVLRECKELQRCTVPIITIDFYYLDMSYTKYSEQCRKGSFAFLDDCELYVNGCEEGTTLEYCKKQQGEGFKDVKCFVGDSFCGRPEQEPLTIEVTKKFSSDPVRAKEEFSLEIFADVVNDGKTLPDFSIKLCMDGNLTRVLNKDTNSDCALTVTDAESGNEIETCYQISGTCLNKSGNTLLARLWFMANEANTVSNFSLDWPGYFASKFSLNIGSETRSCNAGENGDANKNGEIAMDDHDIWVKEYFGETTMDSDFDCSNKIDLLDFEIWRSGYFNRSVSVTPTPRPAECTNGEWKCLDVARAQQCVDGFWKNTICGDGYKCETGICKEIKCSFNNQEYSMGTNICVDTYLPATCMSNGLFEEGDWCESGDWCKDGVCKEITCIKGDEEYKVGQSFCGVQSIFKCGSSGSFYSYACNGTLVSGEKSCQCVPFGDTPVPTPPAGTPVVKCYRPDTGAEMRVDDHYCQNGVFYLCQNTGMVYQNSCVNGCLGDECASEI